MSTWIIWHHDEWMHHPIAVVESSNIPVLADQVHDWAIELDASDHAAMIEQLLTPWEYVADLAGDGGLSDRTGKHEPYEDGSPRDTYADESVMRIWNEIERESNADHR